MNNQEFKELVRLGIDETIKQGVPAYCTVNNNCMYITEDGLSCVVGNMMPETIKNSLVGYEGGVKDIITGELYAPKVAKEWVGLFTEDQIEILSNLQEYHDAVNDIGNVPWLEYFTKKANELYETL